MSQLLEIAEYWSFWHGKLPKTVGRDVALPRELRASLALIIQGVRRSGKSTLLAHLIGHYRLDPAHCAFLNFEDPRLGHPLNHEVLDRLVTDFRKARPRLRRAYFFLDEIQSVDGWQRWLRTQLERPKGNHFILTGSNAHLLSGEMSSVLTGRHQTVELFPFDWREYRRLRPRSSLLDYLHDGGFPEPLSLKDGDRLRQQYFSDIVERDVRERLGARSSAVIKQVVQMAYESTGSELSLRRIAGACGLAVDTVSSYLEACEAAYLVFACPFFAFSERRRAARNKKYYPIDTGLRRLVVTRTGTDRGKLLESAVFVALRRRGLPVAYWRGEGEVDFVVTTSRGIVPVQVSWDGPSPRHERALEAFYETFPHAEEAVFIDPKAYESGLLDASFE